MFLQKLQKHAAVGKPYRTGVNAGDGTRGSWEHSSGTKIKTGWVGIPAAPFPLCSVLDSVPGFCHL